MKKKKGHTEEYRFNEILQELFDNPEFKKSVLEKRAMLGFPKNGFRSVKEFEKWIDEDKGKLSFSLIKAALQILNQLDLSPTFSVVVEARIALGKNYKVYRSESILKFLLSVTRMYEHCGYFCSWEKDKESVHLQIYPGASARGVKDYLARHFKEMKMHLDSVNAPKMPLSRDSKKSERNKEILRLFKIGKINYDGILIDKEATTSEEIRQMNTDTILSVIRKGKK